MKFSKFLMLAGFSALLASCSQDEPLVNNPDGISEDIAKNESYMYVGFQMPSQAGRAGAEPADESKAKDAEYKVRSARILFFEEVGTNEEDFKFVASLPFGSTWDPENTVDDISRYSNVTVTIPENTFKATKSYSALIVLNAPTGYPMPEEGDTFHDWATSESATTFTLEVGDETYMTMVSAPKYQTEAEGGIKTLVHIDQSKIAKKESLLDKTKPAATFYVNRIAAKVSVVADAQGRKYTTSDPNVKGSVTLTSWAADIIAKECYPIQVVHYDVNGSNIIPWHNSNYSYLHGTSEKFPTFARCNWAATPMYNTALTTDTELEKTFTYIKKTGGLPSEWNSDCEYIKPNCMNYMYQLKNRTTRVVIAAKFTREGKSAPETLYRFGSLGTFWTVDDMMAAIKQKAEVILGGKEATVTLKSGVNNGGYYAFNGENGIVSKIEYKETPESSSMKELSSTEYNAVAFQLGLSSNTAKEISYYFEGVCYYPVLIRHFTNEGDGVATPPSFEGEDQYTIDHLGRYGVLRNNWYEINVNSVASIGTPEIPDPTPDPDDKDPEKSLMSIKINMLNWAKRVQNADL